MHNIYSVVGNVSRNSQSSSSDYDDSQLFLNAVDPQRVDTGEDVIEMRSGKAGMGGRPLARIKREAGLVPPTQSMIDRGVQTFYVRPMSSNKQTEGVGLGFSGNGKGQVQTFNIGPIGNKQTVGSGGNGDVGKENSNKRRVENEDLGSPQKKRRLQESQERSEESDKAIEAVKYKLDRMNRCLEDEDYLGAEEACKEGIEIEEIEPIQEAYLYAGLGKACYNQEKYEEAVEAYKKVIRMKGPTPGQICESCCDLGRIYNEQGRYDEAADVLREGSDTPRLLSKYRIESLISLGRVYLELKKYREAVAVFKEALTIRGKSIEQRSRVLVGLGCGYHKERKYGLAIEAFGKCLKMDGIAPTRRADALLGLGSVYFDANKKDKAIETCEKALNVEVDSQLSSLCLLVGKLYKNNEVYSEAIKVIDRGLKIEGIDDEMKGRLCLRMSGICLKQQNLGKAMVYDVLALGYLETLDDENEYKMRAIFRCRGHGGSDKKVLRELIMILKRGEDLVTAEEVWRAVRVLGKLNSRLLPESNFPLNSFN